MKRVYQPVPSTWKVEEAVFAAKASDRKQAGLPSDATDQELTQARRNKLETVEYFTETPSPEHFAIENRKLYGLDKNASDQELKDAQALQRANVAAFIATLN